VIRRAFLGVASAFLLLGGVGALPASAEDPPPIQPPGVTAPTPTGPVTPGPTYVITPGVGGSELPDPSDPQAVEDAKKADRAAAGKPSAPTSDRSGAEPGGKAPAPSGSAVAAPQEPLGTVAAPDPVGLLWRGIAAAVVMLVLFEITVVRRYLLRPRRRAVTAG
jgi:hypothetical protein